MLAAPVLTSSFSGPSSGTYTPGGTGTYTIAIQNTGADPEDSLAVSTDFPAGVSLTSVQCSAQGSASTCATTQAGNDLNVSGLDLAAGDTMTFTLQVAYASSMTVDPLTVTATITASVSVPDRSVSSDLALEADLSVTKTASTTTYTPGSSVTGQYTVTVTNAGPSDASGVTLTDTAETGVTITGWSCTPQADCPVNSSTGNISQVIAPDAGQTLTYTLDVQYAGNMTTDPLPNTATLTVPASLGDPDTNDQSASVDLERVAVSDLRLAFGGSQPSSFVPGGADVTIDFTITNDGPSAAVDAILPLLWGPLVAVDSMGFREVDWACSPLAACSALGEIPGGDPDNPGVTVPSANTPGVGSGQGDELLEVSLASGASVTLTATITFASSARTDFLFSPSINFSFDPDTETNPDPDVSNNSATLTLTVDRQADIAVIKTAPAVVNPGDSFIYEIRVENRGPSDLGPDPDGAPGEVGLELTDIFDSTLRGGLNGPDDCPTNTSAPCWEVCTSDLGVVGDYDPDSCPTGTRTVTSGNISEFPIALAAGSSTTVRAYARTDGNASGSISNTASVVIGPNVTEVPLSPPGPNTSVVTTQIELSTDLSVTLTDGVTTAVPGTQHSYTIVVRNNGTISAPAVSLTDVLPVFSPTDFAAGNDSAGFISGQVDWQCRAFNGACCNSNSVNCGVSAPTEPVRLTNDLLDLAIDLPGQSHVELTVFGPLDPRAFGTLDYEATVTPPSGLIDGNTVNNTAADANTVLVRQAGLVVEKSVRSVTSVNDNEQAPFRLIYDIAIDNTGPSYVPMVEVEDPLTSTALDLPTANWNCAVDVDPGQTVCRDTTGTGALVANVDLDPGGRVLFDVTVDTTDPVAGVVTNTVTADTGTGVFGDSVTTSLIGRARLVVTKTDGRAEMAPGEEIEYTITVKNEGPDDVFDAVVTDQFPLEIDGLAWSCRATTPIPGDIDFIEEAGTGLGNKAGDALTVSPDGLHAYVIGSEDDALYVYSRNGTPGFNFGRVTLIEREADGLDDSGDPGPAVSGMNGPIDVVISPDGFFVHVLSIDADDGASIATFGRVVNPAAANFGELTFLGSTSAGLPLVPTAMAITSGNLYIAGSGDPESDPMASPVDTTPLVSIYELDLISGLPAHDIAHFENVPGAPVALAADGPGDLLFVGGDSVTMFTIDAADAGIPAGRLSFVDADPLIASVTEFAIAPDAPHLYARGAVGGANQLVMLRYADGSGALGLSQQFNYVASDFTLNDPQSTDPLDQPGAPDPLAGPGGIAVAPDGEHLAGVDAAGNLLYVFRRTPNGGLTFQESKIFDLSNAPFDDGGLEGARKVEFTPDGRHLLIAASASGQTGSPLRDTNTPLAVYSRLAPDPLFAFLENDRNDDAGVDGLLAPNDVAISPGGGEHVYTVSLPDNAVVRFDRSPRLGLDPDSLGQHLQYAESYVQGVNGVDGLDRPRRILISPDGTTVFVSSEANDSIAVFERDAAGTLTLRDIVTNGLEGVTGIAGAQGMAMDSTSTHLYVAGSFGASIARFRLDNWTLSFEAVVVDGVDGVSGLAGIRDLALSDDDRQLTGVSTLANSVVVFDRDAASASGDFGDLVFVQRLQTSIGQRPIALAIAPSLVTPRDGGAHIYVASQNSNSIAVLRRVTDPSSSAFGQVQPIQLLASGQDGLEFMEGPRDVVVSPDGKRVYVAAEFSDAVLVFDRDLNSSSSSFGTLSPVEIRRDGVRGVDGLRQVRGLAISNDSRNVYAAGFGEGALASFRLGTGSVCTAGGSGTIADEVDIGVGGTIEYTATGTVRANAAGTLSNTVSVALPENFIAEDPQTGCPYGGDFCFTDTTRLVPEGTVDIEKTSGQVSVTAGGIAEYTITIENAGPSSLVNDAPDFPLNLSDLLDDNAAFVDGSAVWSCVASGSGSLDFLDAQFDLVPGLPGMPDTGGPFEALAGISGLALVPGTPGQWLVGASVVDDAIAVYTRDPVTGELLTETALRSGDLLDGETLALDGAQAVVVDDDGRFLYIASRTSDSVTVLSIADDGLGNPDLGFVQAVTGAVGLNQAVDLVLSTDDDQLNLYVAGANDDAIAVFARSPATGMLTVLPAVQQGLGGVTGLADVSSLRVSPDGAHLYALSPTSGRVTVFDRLADGSLQFLRGYGGADLGAGIAGASSVVIDSLGQFVYISAETDNRIVVLERDANGELILRSIVSQDDAGVGGLVGARRLALSGDGEHLYVSSQAGSSIAWFRRDEEDGSLRFGGLRGNESSALIGLGGATGLVVDNVLDQVFVAGTMQSAISRFQRAADSSCPVSGTGQLENVPFNIGAGGSVVFNIAVEVASSVTGDPNTGSIVNEAILVAARDPRYPDASIFNATTSNVVSTTADLTISKDDGLREIDGLANALDVAAVGSHVYSAGADDNAIGIFRRNTAAANPDLAVGDLEFRAAVRSGENGVEGVSGVADLALSPDGAHLYSASPLENGVAGFARDPVDGSLDFLGLQQNGVLGVNGLSGAAAVTVSADGEHVYAVGEFSNAIASFRRNSDSSSPDYGRLSFLEFDQNGVNGVSGTGAPVALAASLDGRHVYVAGAEADTIAVFERNRLPASAGFGRLVYVTHYTQNQAGVAGLGAIKDVAISDDGATVYALGSATGTLAWFTRDDATGELAFQGFKQDGTANTTGLTGAASIQIDPSGQGLYVAGAAAASIVRFDLDVDGVPDFAGIVSDGDASTANGGQVFGLAGVAGLAFEPGGAHLYAASSGRDAVLTFVADASAVGVDFQQILTDGTGGVAPGDPVVYTIRVENLGPSDVPQARVVDQFPDEFESVSWICSAEDGTNAACLEDGVGDIDEIVELPVGGVVIFEATGLVSAGASGRLVNTATVSALGVADLNQTNNSATDDDTVLSTFADLAVTVDNEIDAPDVVVPGDAIHYNVIVRNGGPSSVRGVFVEDVFPPALYDVAWSCTAVPSAGTLDPPIEVGAPFVPAAIAFTSNGRWAYAVGGNSVQVFRRNPLSGDLVPVQQVVNGSDGVIGIRGASDVAISSDGRYVYVAGATSDAIARFERDGDTGELSFADLRQDGLGGVEGLGGVLRLLLSPDGGRLYAAGGEDNALAVFDVDGTDGSLLQTGRVAQGEGGVDGLNGITDMTFNADASLLLVVAGANQSLTTFELDGVGGALGFVETLLNDDLLGGPAEDALLGAAAVRVTPDDEVLVAASSTDRIGRFELRTRDVAGVLTTRPVPVGLIEGAGLGVALTSPTGLVFDPDRARLYVSDVDGVLLINLLADAPLPIQRYDVATYPLLGGVGPLRLGPSERHLYTLGSTPGAEIGVWGRERGSRCPLDGRGDLGRQEVDIVAGGELVYRLDGRVRANATGTLDYTVRVENPDPSQEDNPLNNSDTDSDPLGPAADLAVTKTLDTAPLVAGLPVDWTLTVDNLGLSDAPGAIVTDTPPVFPDDPGGILSGSGAWSCDANTPLSDGTPFTAPESLSSLAIDPDGAWLYATSASAGALLAFPLDPAGGIGAASVIREGDVFPQDGGAPDRVVSGLAGASDVAAASGGLHVYATGATGNSVLVFAREDAAAPLEFVASYTTESPPGADSVPGLRGARDVALSPDERFVFVAGAASNAVVVFERDPDLGTLRFVERVADGIGTIVPEFNVIRDVAALHPSRLGTDLYSVAEFSEAIARFSINEQTGVLTFEQVLRAGGAVPDLAGMRDLAVAPGDTQLYALTDAGVAIFDRADDGSLSFVSMFDPGGGAADGVALVVDASGSRAYLLATGTGTPIVHVLRRDWIDGSLELWFSQPIGGAVPQALVQSVATGHLLVGGTGPDLLRFDEQALSRCAETAGSGDALITTVDLGVGGDSSFALSAVVHPSARGTLDNTVSAAPGNGSDPVPGNNQASASGPITVVSDIGVTKTGPADAVAGTTIGYSITVTNAGPSDALGIQVRDLAPPPLSGFTWTCSATAGSTCPASGSTVPDFSADVLVGGQLDIDLTATIDPAFIGELINVVLLTPEVDSTDPTPLDHRAEWITNVRAEADLQVTKTTISDPVIAGLPVEYRLTAINAGPSDAPSVSLTDLLPNVIIDPGWTCTPTGGAACPATGSGDVSFIATMPAGSAVEIRVLGDLGPGQTGVLDNTFSATVEPPATDPDPSNNSAAVSDPITVVADLVLVLNDPLDPFDPAGPIGMPYVATITNLGPSTATGIELDLVTSAPVTPQSPGCVNPSPTDIRCLTAPLAPAQTKVFDLVLFDLPAAPATLVIDGLVSTVNNDPDLLNNADSTSTELRTGPDLDVRLDNARSWLSPGEDVVYRFTVTNIGSVAAPIVDIDLPSPIELLDPTWTCVASGSASCLGSGNGGVIDTASLPSGGTVEYSLFATVDPAIDLSLPRSVVMSGLAETSPPTADINPANNVAADVDEVRLVMFSDGFESPVRTAAIQRSLTAGCTEIELAHPGKATGTIIEGRSAAGRRLFWIEAASRGERSWLQGIAIGDRSVEASGWLEWPRGTTDVRIDGRRLTVAFDDGRSWRPGDPLPAPVGRVTRPARDAERGALAPFDLAACDASAAPQGAGR